MTIYTILISKTGLDGLVTIKAIQRTYESVDDAIDSILAYGDDFEAYAILELEEDGRTQAYFGAALDAAIETYQDNQRLDVIQNNSVASSNMVSA